MKVTIMRRTIASSCLFDRDPWTTAREVREFFLPNNTDAAANACEHWGCTLADLAEVAEYVIAHRINAKVRSRPVPNTNEIAAFFHCTRCLNERPEGTSPRDWAQLEVGWTKRGLQVWCKRHDCNVLHIDFEGINHPANTTAKKEGN
jgi:hypothetical protein